jgi:release factor glutamine methyltransferase
MRLGAAARQLAPSSDTARLDAELLLAHVLGVNRAWLAAHDEETVAAPEFQTLVERRAAGEPLAYIVGYKDFWTLRLEVTPHVLVPRPETELLVELALRNEALSVSVADLGTGSGAIALALASTRPGWNIAGTDISAEALELARRNASKLGVRNVEFLQGSWFAPLAGRRFSLIASNPPYVSANDAALAHPTLQFEPQQALIAGPDGMASLDEIIRGAPAYLEPRGALLLEHGSDQAHAVSNELVARGFRHVRSHRDLAGHERVTEAQWI